MTQREKVHFLSRLYPWAWMGAVVSSLGGLRSCAVRRWPPLSLFAAPHQKPNPAHLLRQTTFVHRRRARPTNSSPSLAPVSRKHPSSLVTSSTALLAPTLSPNSDTPRRAGPSLTHTPTQRHLNECPLRATRRNRGGGLRVEATSMKGVGTEIMLYNTVLLFCLFVLGPTRGGAQPGLDQLAFVVLFPNNLNRTDSFSSTLLDRRNW